MGYSESAIIDSLKNLAGGIGVLLLSDDTREKNLALTKIQEAIMWLEREQKIKQRKKEMEKEK